MTLMTSIAKVGSLTMLSRVLGFVRDMMTAMYLGAGPIADAFFVAFRLPNFFRSFFAEGAFSASFVPIFSGLVARDGRDAAMRFANQSLSVLLVFLLIFSVLGEIFMPQVMTVIAPGFTDSPEQFDMVVLFSRITFPYLLLISLVAFMGGIQNSLDQFSYFAASPIWMNVAMIAAMVTIIPYCATAGHGMAYGVLLSGVVQYAWMHYGCRAGHIRLTPAKPVLSPEVRKLGRMLLPAAMGSGVLQVNLLLGVMLASFLPDGSVSYLYYADRLAQLPLGVIGVAIGTALLPLLSKQLRSADPAPAMHSQNRAIEAGLFLTLPAAVALMVIPVEIMSVLFQRGKFDDITTLQSAYALVGLASGIPAYVMVKVLSPGFFAREDTRTPVKIAALSVVINFAINLLLMWRLQHVGIAIGTSVGAWMNALTLGYVLHRRGHLILDARLRAALPRMALCAAVLGVAVYGLRTALPITDADRSTLARVLSLAVLVGLGTTLYFATAWATGIFSRQHLKSLLRRPSKAAQ